VDYESFIGHIEQALGVDTETAESAARAVLQTLAERIERGEARDLAEVLPPELAPWLHKDRPEAEAFHLDEFLRRVAERAEVDAEAAERYAVAVLAAIGRSAPDELADAAAQLPSDFDRVLPSGRAA
jgi:uncharacterized protein (DUF2267 family)